MPQSFYVYLSHAHLWLHREALAYILKMPVFGHKEVATIHHILCALSISSRCIHISTDESCGMHAYQVAQILVLTHQFIACREDEDDVCPCQSKVATRWHGSPHIFTNLNTETQAVRSLEYLWSRCYRHLLHAECNGSFVDI